MIYTPDDSSYDYSYITTSRSRSWASFSVKACFGVSVALAATPGDINTNTYEVVLGGWGNTRSVGMHSCKTSTHIYAFFVLNIVR